MPIGKKRKMGHGDGRPAKRRARPAITSSIQRAYGANQRRGMIPAVLRSRSSMATELKSCDGCYDLETYSGTLTSLEQFLHSASSAPFELLDLPIEGASFYNRIARRTRGVYLHLKGNILPTLANTAAKSAQYARILIVYDRQPNGAKPSLSTVLADYPNGGTAQTTAHSGVNPDNRDRFLVLRDKKFLLPAIGANGVAPTTTSANFTGGNGDLPESNLVVNEFIKLNGLETQYKASSGGAVGDISTGSYLMILLDELDAATSAWCLSYNVRYAFYD